MIRELRALWPMLDPFAVDASLLRWLEAVAPVVGRGHASSSALAAEYYRRFRLAEGLAGSVPAVIVQPLPPAQVAGVLTATGPGRIKAATARGVPITKAVDDSFAEMAGAATRLIMKGGRDTVLDAVTADGSAVGWARVTSGNACAFCVMLASRGHVFKSEETASFDAHGACNCQPEPAFSRDATLPPSTQRARDLWNEAQSDAAADGELRRGTSNDALNALRRRMAAG